MAKSLDERVPVQLRSFLRRNAEEVAAQINSVEESDLAVAIYIRDFHNSLIGLNAAAVGWVKVLASSELSNISETRATLRLLRTVNA